MEGKRRSHDRSDRSIVRVDLDNRLRLGIASFVVREVIDFLLSSRPGVFSTTTSDSLGGVLRRDIEFDDGMTTKIWLLASNDLSKQRLRQRTDREQKESRNLTFVNQLPTSTTLLLCETSERSRLSALLRFLEATSLSIASHAIRKR